MNWRAVLGDRILTVLFVANAGICAMEFFILPAFSQLVLPLLVVNFLLFSGLIAAHFHFHSKDRALYSASNAGKLSFQQQADNLFYLPAAATISIVLCSVLTRPFPAIFSAFPVTAWSLLTLIISLRWTSHFWKSQGSLVLKQMLHFSRTRRPSFESILLADILTTFARPISSLFVTSKIIRAIIFRIKQCLLDGHDRRVSLWNTVKYVGLLASGAVLSHQPQLPLFYFCFPFLSVAFASWWDVVMDWNDYMIVPTLLNTSIRLLPVLTTFTVGSDRLHFVVNALEVYRRSVWTVLRIRNHHRKQHELHYRTI